MTIYDIGNAWKNEDSWGVMSNLFSKIAEYTPLAPVVLPITLVATESREKYMPALSAATMLTVISANVLLPPMRSK